MRGFFNQFLIRGEKRNVTILQTVLELARYQNDNKTQNIIHTRPKKETEKNGISRFVWQY